MRLRNVKGAREKISASISVIDNPKEYKGKWRELFKNNNPIYIEIGMGKGKFIIENAIKNPNINFIGIEKFSSVLVRAIERKENNENDLSNLVFLRFDAEYIEDIFDKSEIGRIYLNFSDPWPKDRHAKRRLTSKEYFKRYDNILCKDGKVIFKTDNKDLFDFSLDQIDLAGWKLINSTNDLHNSEYVKGNIMTEYEERFVNEGVPINRLEAMR